MMIRVKTMRPVPFGDTELRFDIEVYESTDGVEWFIVDGAPDALYFQAGEILDITNDEALTDAEKKGALAEMFTTKLVSEYKLGQRNEAEKDLNDLMAGEWPVTINL